jgi:hypothetical protein
MAHVDLKGGRMHVSPTTIELDFPFLFNGERIEIQVADVAFCDTVFEPESDSLEGSNHADKVDLVLLTSSRRPTFNFALFRARPGFLPRIRPRARFTGVGHMYHRERRTPHDGYMLECLDVDYAARLLSDVGIENTARPYAWIRSRRT